MYYPRVGVYLSAVTHTRILKLVGGTQFVGKTGWHACDAAKNPSKLSVTILVGGLNPFEKHYIVKMGIFPK